MSKIVGLMVFVLIAWFAFAIYQNSKLPDANFEIRLHYMNGEIETRNIVSRCFVKASLETGYGSGSPKTNFTLGLTRIPNVCRFEILSIDTILNTTKQ